MAQPFKIVFALYPRLTQLDFTGPFEVLSRVPGAEAIVASKEGGAIVSETGLTFADLTRLSDIDRCDMICVPGGPGQTDAMLDPAFLAEIKRLGSSARYVTSVCTGSLILAAAGLLTGKRAASHWYYRDMLALFGAIPDPARVVRDGDVITAGGVTAGIDFALTIAAELAGRDVAQAMELMLEYDPQPPFGVGRPERAPQALIEAVGEQLGAFRNARENAIKGLVADA